MLFKNKEQQHKIATLESELSSFYGTEDDLRHEMIYFTLDSDGYLSESNTLLSNSLSYSIAELNGKNIQELLCAKSLPKEHVKNMLKAVHENKHWHGALHLISKHNQEVWLRAMIHPNPSQTSDKNKLRVYAVELTNTINTSRQYQDIITALHRSLAVIEFDLSGNILNANENFLRCVKYRKQDIIGKHHQIFCRQEEVNSSDYQRFWQTLAAGEFVSDRFQRLDRYGHIVWLEASYNPVHDDSGELYKIVKFAPEITEQMDRETAIAETANVAYHISLQTDQQASAGIAVIQDTMTTMNALATEMAQASEGVYSLDKQSSQIAALVESIHGIAEQTNLLALNAAIEAARAGEQGRGFAVVADEVRKLAARTSSVTQQIVEVVTKNKELTANAVALINHSQQGAHQALQLANEAGAAMNKMQAGAKEVVTAVSEFNNTL